MALGSLPIEGNRRSGETIDLKGLGAASSLRSLRTPPFRPISYQSLKVVAPYNYHLLHILKVKTIQSDLNSGPGSSDWHM